MLENFKKLASYLWGVFKKFNRDGCFSRASALSYATLFSLVPITAISFSLFSSFTAFKSFREQVERFIFKNFLPSSAAKIQEYIQNFVGNTTTLNIIGLVFLVIGSVFIIDTIEVALNEIWSVKGKRPWGQKFASFWAFLTLTPLLLGLSFYVSARLSEKFGSSPIFHMPFITKLFLLAFPVLLAWGAFFVIYYFLPYIEVSAKPALIGSGFTSIIWEISKHIFDWYITTKAAYNHIYGTMAVIIIFLIWMYFFWLFVLFGAEITATLQWPELLTGEKITNYRKLKAFILICENFEKGRGATPLKPLAKKLHTSPHELKTILDIFVEKEIIENIDGKYLPVKPPSKISLGELLEYAGIIDLPVPEKPTDKLDEFLIKFALEMKNSIKERYNINLKEVIEHYG